MPEDRPAPADAVRLRQAPDVLSRHSLEALLLLTPGMQDPMVLTGAGPALWDQFAEPATLVDAFRSLSEHFNVPAERLRADFDEVVGLLRTTGALEVAHRFQQTA